jgi:hypothetical protein
VVNLLKSKKETVMQIMETVKTGAPEEQGAGVEENKEDQRNEKIPRPSVNNMVKFEPVQATLVQLLRKLPKRFSP